MIDRVSVPVVLMMMLLAFFLSPPFTETPIRADYALLQRCWTKMKDDSPSAADNWSKCASDRSECYVNSIASIKIHSIRRMNMHEYGHKIYGHSFRSIRSKRTTFTFFFYIRKQCTILITITNSNVSYLIPHRTHVCVSCVCILFWLQFLLLFYSFNPGSWYYWLEHALPGVHWHRTRVQVSQGLFTFILTCAHGVCINKNASKEEGMNETTRKKK